MSVLGLELFCSGVVTHVCNISTWEAEAMSWLGIQGLPGHRVLISTSQREEQSEGTRE